MSALSRLWFVAAEASGDLLARETIEAIRKRVPDLCIRGIGGAELAAIGIVSPIDIAPLSVLGFMEGIKAYRDVVRLADAATDAILANPPDTVVLVDSWGFTLRVAQRLRQRAPGIRLIKMIGPQVWATRPGRAKTLSATVDHLLAMHEMEVAFYKPFNLPVTVIGNPALSRISQGDGAAFRKAYSVAPDQPMMLVLPGSRVSEIRLVAPALIEAAHRLYTEDPRRAVFVAPAQSIAADFAARFPVLPEGVRVISDPAARYDAMRASTFVLSCSGTVTTEVAMQDAPQLVAYKTGWITWALARGLLYSRKHICLLNIVSDDQEIVPEFVQTRLKSSLIFECASRLLGSPDALKKARESQARALSRMGGFGSSTAEIAADVILSPAPPRA